MNSLTSLLIAFSLFDAIPQPVTPVIEPRIYYAASGEGELLVQQDRESVIGSVPLGASRVAVRTVNLSASCDADVTVDSILLQHSGLGQVTDVKGVYFTDGDRRVSRSSRFDSQSRQTQLHFPNFVIPKCSARTLSIRMDFSPRASVASEHGVRIVSPESIGSSAKEVTLTEVDAKSSTYTTPYRLGTISVNFLPIRGPLRYGRVETVARIQLTSDDVSSHILKKMTLKNTEDAHDMDLVYFRLENTRGELLSAPATRMHGDTVVIEFSPTYLLDSRKTVVVLLKAEVRASQRRKVNFTLEEASDLVSIPVRPR